MQDSLEASALTYNSDEDPLICVFCGKRTPGFRDESCLKCTNCQTMVHFSCLTHHVKISECCLLGDVFYKFTCKSCSPTGSEQVSKEKVSWLTALILALYNLQELQHLSRHGYFHWKLHIADFIDRKWAYIFGGSVRRKRAWHGTVSGTLSHYSPSYFQTGTTVLRESGWWKLTLENMSPYNMVRLKYESNISTGKRSTVKSNHEDETAEDDPCLSSFHSDTIQPANANERMSPDFDSDMLSFSDSESLDVDIDLPMDIEKDVGFPRMDSELSELIDQYVTSEEVHSSSSYISHTLVKCEYDGENYNSERDSDNSVDSDGETVSAPPPKSLFSSRENRPLPWQNSCVSLSSESQSCVPMTEYEELQLIQKLSTYIVKDPGSMPCQILRLYRKLIVRREQRHRRLGHFSDILSSICNFGSLDSVQKNGGIRTLDRYQVVGLSEENQLLKNDQQSFMLRLLGQVEPRCFVSPYTERLLKPYIRRDYISEPLRLRLMADILQRANGKNTSWCRPQRYPIDYTYVQPHHIPAVNSLCELFFWPGIDLTESLLYPDFSCVALYRKLVIGFAFMVPDVSYNESYISFLFTRPEWRRASIATFMLYHLIQTCMGKDITLHVSVTNPAVMLYQKFGFKVEELVQDFYDKYLPSDSKDCKHALFLRLSR